MEGINYQRRSLAGEWKKTLQKSLDPKSGIAGVVNKYPPLTDWPKLRSAPTGRAEDQTRYAVQIAAADYDNPLVKICLQRALEVVDAAESDIRWDTWWRASKRVEHGRLLAVSAIARAWLSDEGLDETSCKRSAEELFSGALEERPAWSEMAQSEYLLGIQMLLMAGELEEARDRLTLEKEFRSVQQYFDWHARLLELVGNKHEDIENLRAHFDPYFDLLRDPLYQSPINDTQGRNVVGIAHVRLRLALIRWIYIERKPIAGNWRHIIGQIGY